jgi:hypothetical protein
MQRVLAIARLAVSNAVRSRVVLSLLALLLLAIFALPLTLKSDGTLAGHIQIVLTYTLNVTFLLLAVASLWSGCAAIAGEIEEKQAHLLVTKPVTHLQIWLGKWLGLLFINAVLLLISAAVVYGLLMWSIRPGVLSAEERARVGTELLVARHRTSPLPPADLPARVRAKADAIMATGRVPASMTRGDVETEVRESLEREDYSVGPGQTGRWTFALPPTARRDRDTLLTFVFSSSQPQPEPVRMKWRLGGREIEGAATRAEGYHAGLTHNLLIPAALVTSPDRVTIELAVDDDETATVLFDRAKGLTLRTYAGGFEGNLLRALLRTFARLALLAALGVTAGALLSTPVAVFIAAAIAFIVQWTGQWESLAQEQVLFAAHSHGGPAPSAGLWDVIFSEFYRFVLIFLGPLRDSNVFGQLGAAELITWSSVAVAWAIKLGVYSGGMALLSAWLMGRREIGAPS